MDCSPRGRFVIVRASGHVSASRRSLSPARRHLSGVWAACLVLVFAGLPPDAAAQPPVAVLNAPTAASDVQLELARLQQQIDKLRYASQLEVEPICPEPIELGMLSPRPLAVAPPADEEPEFPLVRLTGFFHADAAWFDQDTANRLALGNGDAAAGDIQDGAGFRRARLAAIGEAWDNVGYLLEMDFAFPGRPSFMDVWLDIDDVVGSANLRVGQFRQPFSMSGLTSAKEMPFLERGLPFVFLPFRQIGVMTYGQGDDQRMTWAVSGFRFPTDAFGSNVGDNGGYGLSTRVTRLLVGRDVKSGLVHVGGGYSFADPASDVVRFRGQPEIFVGQDNLAPVGVPSAVPAFVETGLIPTENLNLFNAELAVARGSFFAQSEAMFAHVQQQDGPSLTFPGAYAQAGYLLTGEFRPYKQNAGVFGEVLPYRSVGRERGIGAWEITARWSYIDLSDDNIQGGRLNDLTAGLNWHLNPNTKFQFNYIHAFLDSPLYGDSDADIFATRAQLEF